MTKFKQGDRVVPERFHGGLDNPMFFIRMEKYIGVEGEITYINEMGWCVVHDCYWPSSALRPASPKWEPVTGQEYYLIGSNQVVKYIGYNEESKEYVFYHKENDLYDAWLLEYIRPIAPSPEDILKFNLAAKLWGTEVRVASEMAEMLMPIILDWHNRHKEGGQNDND